MVSTSCQYVRIAMRARKYAGRRCRSSCFEALAGQQRRAGSANDDVLGDMNGRQMQRRRDVVADAACRCCAWLRSDLEHRGVVEAQIVERCAMSAQLRQ